MLAARPGRRLVAGLAGAALAVAIGCMPGLSPAASAVEGVNVTGHTTLNVQPQRRRVHVVSDLAISNDRPSTTSGNVTTDWLIQEWSLAVPDQAEHVRVMRGDRRLPTTIRERDGYDIVQVDLRPDVRFGQTADLRVTYDLPDGGARSSSPIRVGRAYLSFYAFAHGDDQATVRIVVPTGYEVDTNGGPIEVSATSDGGTILETRGSVDDVRWYVVVRGERPDALEVEEVSVDVDGQARALEIRSWPEDAFWAQRVRDRLTSGLAALHDLHGLDWPVIGPLRVTESATDSLSGYAGFYDPGERGVLDEILMSEEPDELVIVHEAAHAWFNDALLTGRWVSEGLADAYAARALVELGSTPPKPDVAYRDTPVAFALNLWAPPERIDSQAAHEREAYGYDASRLVFDALLDEIGEPAMRDVLAAADAQEIAYAGRPPAERHTNVADFRDWRYLLDLLQQRGGSREAGALFETWVVSDTERPLLDDHERVVRRYASLLAEADGWLPGQAIRAPLARWAFDGVDDQLDMAETVIERRSAIERRAGALVLDDGGALESAFEAARTSYQPVVNLADDQLAAIEAVEVATRTLAAERGPLVALGLLGADTTVDLAEAAEAYEAGRLTDSVAQAAEAVALIDGAASVGQQRAAMAGAGVLFVLVLGAGSVVIVRRRRRASRSAIEATAAVGGANAPATLAARPEPATSGDGDPPASTEGDTRS
jgi:hypothetical protein